MEWKHVVLYLFVILTGFDIQCQNRIHRELNQFTSLIVSSGFDVYLNQDANDDVFIDCDENSVSAIQTSVEDGILILKATKAFKWKVGKTPKIFVSINKIKQIEVKGGSDLFSLETLNFDSVKIMAYGASDVYLAVKCLAIKTHTDGGASITLNGTTNRLDAQAFGSSDVNASNLKAKICYLTASDGADIHVNVVDELVVTAKKNSVISYLGTPIIKRITDDGSSHVYRK